MPENNEKLKKLDALKNNSQFSVPEGYWGEFNDKIKAKIITKEQKGSKSYLRTIRPQLALAASFAALFILSYTVFRALIPESQLSENDIYIALEKELFDLDEAVLYESLSKEIMQPTYTEFELSEQEILDYLSEESSDMDIYHNEF
jgi:hypothetical protein